MANDGSVASLVEEWIATQLRALPEFADDAVEVFPGNEVLSGQQVIDELTKNRSPYATVFFRGDAPLPLEEGQQGYDPTYVVWVVVQNMRPGTARFGDGTTPGTNKMRDLLRTALHDKFPNLNANGFYTDGVKFGGVQIVFQRKDAWILEATLVIRETPA